MQNVAGRKAYFPIIYLFLGIAALILILEYALPGTSVNFHVLHIGNLLLFVVGCVSLQMNTRALHHKNVQVFLRLVYGSFFLKFFILATCAVIYIAIYKKDINKPALFGCFGLYFVYMIIEVRSVMKQRKKPNA